MGYIEILCTLLSAQFCYDPKTALTKYSLLEREKNPRKPTDG